MNLKIKIQHFVIAGVLILSGATSCKHKPPVVVTPGIDPAATQYPLEVAKILAVKCATAGCHNEASYSGAGGLRMDDWQYLFDGSSNGAVVIPYNPENSSLLYFLNPPDPNKPNKGLYDPISLEPMMPFNETPLTKDEYNVIKDWVTNGAPDKNGNIPFGSNPDTRQKAYLTLQGCDLVGVLDAEKKVIMRLIKVGVNPASIESPHVVKVDKQGIYAYTCFVGGGVIQKIDTRTDKIVAQADLSIYGASDWNVVHISEDGQQLLATQLRPNGNVVLINSVTMTPVSSLALLGSPHGIEANQAFDTFYITGQYGNTIYKLAKSKVVKSLSLDGKPPVNVSGETTMNPHEIIMLPDYSKYFVSCEKTNEVRVMDRLGDTLLKVIPVGRKPQEMSISKIKPYLFVTCMEDISNAGSLYKGSVYVINYNTYDIVKRIDGMFYQPHGIAVDDNKGLFYIASRNALTDGPAPHHTSDCGGRNGYYQVYDLNTLEPANKRRYEVTPDPYYFEVRFK